MRSSATAGCWRCARPGDSTTSWRPPSRGSARERAAPEEVRRLTEDPAAIEEIARRDLGLIRPGEKVFIVKDLKSPAKP